MDSKWYTCQTQHQRCCRMQKKLAVSIILNIAFTCFVAATLGFFYHDINQRLNSVESYKSHKISKRSTLRGTHMDQQTCDGVFRCQRGRNCRCYQSDPALPGISRPTGQTTTQPESTTQKPQKLVSQRDGIGGHSFTRPGGISSLQLARAAVAVSGGETFVKWGNRHCPGAHRPVLSGFMAGALSSDVAGGNNILCLPRLPASSVGNFPLKNINHTPLIGPMIFDTSLRNSIVECAICQLQVDTNKVMMPGLRDCPSGWNEVYQGWLMGAAGTGRSSVGYICVDRDPPIEQGNGGGNGTKLTYVQFSSRGCLSSASRYCIHYQAMQRLACVVCSK